jgi:hypothetical protein
MTERGDAFGNALGGSLVEAMSRPSTPDRSASAVLNSGTGNAVWDDAPRPSMADQYVDTYGGEVTQTGAVRRGNGSSVAGLEDLSPTKANAMRLGLMGPDGQTEGAWSSPVTRANVVGVPLPPFGDIQNSGPTMGYADQMSHVGQFLATGAIGAAEVVGGGIYNYGVRLVGGAASVPYLLDSVDAAVAVQEGFKDRFGYSMQSSGAQAFGQAVQPVGQWVQDNVMSPTRTYSERLIGDGATTVLGGVAQAGLEIAGVVTGGRAAASILDNSVFVTRPTAGMLYGGIPVDTLLGTTRITTVTGEMSDAFQGMKYLDPLSNTFVTAPLRETMAVDHIFPSAKIVELPGFNTLTKSQMTSIIQDTTGELGNLQPLPKSFNSSKGSSTNWTEYKGQALDSGYATALREAQGDARARIVDRINTYQRLNQLRGR